MKIRTCEDNSNHLITKIKNDQECRENLNDRTASKTEVHREEDKRRWLGPPSFPLIEPGRVMSSVTTPDQKTEHDNLVNETSSSCQTTWTNNMKLLSKAIKRKTTGMIHTRNESNTTTNSSKMIVSSMKLRLSTILGMSRSLFILLVTRQIAVLSWITWSSSIKLETRIRNFTATHSEEFFFLQTSPPWSWMNCIKGLTRVRIERSYKKNI